MSSLGFVLDLFFPRQNSDFSSIHSYLIENEVTAQNSFYKILDRDQKQYLESIFVASSLNNSLISDLIHRAKLGLEYSISKDLGNLLYTKILAESELPKPGLIVPIPADPNRFLIRGYHLPDLVARQLSTRFKVESVPIVYKKYSTRQQTLLDRNDRLINLKNKFELITPLPVNLAKHDIIWLVDDITTTGSTLYEVAKVIKTQFPYLKIHGMVVASN